MIAGTVGGDSLLQRTSDWLLSDTKSSSRAVAAYPGDSGAAAAERGCRVGCRKTYARFCRAIGIRSVKHQRMMQTHFARPHDHEGNPIELWQPKVAEH